MTYALRALRFLSMVVWVGGLIFFAFVEAPTAAHIMGTTRQFALLIAGSIGSINSIGYRSGMVFILCSLLEWQRAAPRTRKLLAVELPLAIVMFVAVLYVQRGIVPAMERDRGAANGDIQTLAEDNPVRAHFDRLHATSEKVEGAALLLGVAVVLLMAGEVSRQDRPEPVTH